ncbi:D-serine dehydratase, partial [Aeromonas hydrophila]
MKNIDVQQLTAQFPLVQSLIALEPVTWFNPNTTTLAAGLPYGGRDNNNV